MMSEFFNGVVLVLKYSVEDGFWHFIACLLIIRVLTGFTTLVRFEKPLLNSVKKDK